MLEMFWLTLDNFLTLSLFDVSPKCLWSKVGIFLRNSLLSVPNGAYLLAFFESVLGSNSFLSKFSLVPKGALAETPPQSWDLWWS